MYPFFLLKNRKICQNEIFGKFAKMVLPFKDNFMTSFHCSENIESFAFVSEHATFM